MLGIVKGKLISVTANRVKKPAIMFSGFLIVKL
jgi:hypothetical protein